MGEKKSFLCRIPSNLCGYFSLKKSYLPTSCALHTETSSLRVRQGQENGFTLECRNLVSTTSAK